jgi:predicted transcriptional regulator
MRGLLLLESKRVVSNHRGNFDIIADILGASIGGAKKTNLMYRCNLSFRQLKSYSHFLLETGMLRVKGRPKSESVLFEATEKGKQFLRAYGALKALMH